MRSTPHFSVFSLLPSPLPSTVSLPSRRPALTLDVRTCSPVDASNKVNRICDLVRHDLHERGDMFHWANTILTAHVRKRPPAYEDALKVLVDLKGASARLSFPILPLITPDAPPACRRAAQDPERAEDAVKYIIFLSDANKLFDLALGMYDFPLVLMVAQQSQKVSRRPPAFWPPLLQEGQC